MRIIGPEEYLVACLKPKMEKIEPCSDSVEFRLEVKVDRELREMTLSFSMYYDEKSEAPPRENVKQFEFDNCFPFAQIPQGAIDIGKFAAAHFAPLETFETGLATLLTAEAKLTLTFEEETLEDEDVDGNVFAELTIHHFRTSLKLPLERFKDFLAPIKSRTMARE